eukprot:CAMPEP_0202869510 /NCGR_PEP_ID=MMETSP1391-20130828/12496_1 /ASSEMBLY_ACC=CAM_ASM_000867 /TAXON_ID=1034604 /ORGANISM="Chlamydomonas leiostraca, Strain SAG 11-49" /LENGTH=59 /DNA_ID=CAMNT_0049549837 /DNA_START=302 /DNA_END=477 /DNA_ORIENTATION=+
MGSSHMALSTPLSPLPTPARATSGLSQQAEAQHFELTRVELSWAQASSSSSAAASPESP